MIYFIFASGSPSIGVSASVSVLPMSIWDWFPLGLTGWISLQSKGLLRVFSTWTTWCEELTHRKRPWCWERLKVGGEGDNRGRDGLMASLMQWTWVWVSSRSWWWTGRPGMLQFMGSQRVGHNWATELNWTDDCITLWIYQKSLNHKL